MKRRIAYIGVLLNVYFCSTSIYGQTWKKEYLNIKSDTLFAKYSWNIHNEYHYSSGHLIFTKFGRFTYQSQKAFSDEDFSAGTYSINKDTIVLNSDLQTNNLKINIEYLDRTINDTLLKILDFPMNIKGEQVRTACYYINHDSTIAGVFYPDFPLIERSRKLLDSMSNLSVRFNNSGFGSPWTNVKQSNKLIRVTILTDRDYEGPQPKVITNYKFLIKRKRLVDITNSL